MAFFLVYKRLCVRGTGKRGAEALFRGFFLRVVPLRRVLGVEREKKLPKWRVAEIVLKHLRYCFRLYDTKLVVNRHLLP